MRDIIINLFGIYTPVTYNDGVNDVIPSGMAGVDWTFIAGVFLFSLTLYCVFRVIGGIFKNVNSR